MTPVGNRYRLEFLVPSRGLFGYRSEFLTDTRGEGIMSSVLDSYAPMKGEIERRLTGSLISFESGEAVTYGPITSKIRVRALKMVPSRLIRMNKASFQG